MFKKLKVDIIRPGIKDIFLKTFGFLIIMFLASVAIFLVNGLINYFVDIILKLI